MLLFFKYFFYSIDINSHDLTDISPNLTKDFRALCPPSAGGVTCSLCVSVSDLLAHHAPLHGVPQSGAAALDVRAASNHFLQVNTSQYIFMAILHVVNLQKLSIKTCLNNAIHLIMIFIKGRNIKEFFTTKMIIYFSATL